MKHDINQNIYNTLPSSQQQEIDKILENIKIELNNYGNLNNICNSLSYNDNGSISYEILYTLGQ